MTPDETFVIESHPKAIAYHYDAGTWKIYVCVNDCWIAISKTCDSRDEAWTKAANAIRERDARNALTPIFPE